MDQPSWSWISKKTTECQRLRQYLCSHASKSHCGHLGNKMTRVDQPSRLRKSKKTTECQMLRLYLCSHASKSDCNHLGNKMTAHGSAFMIMDSEGNDWLPEAEALEFKPPFLHIAQGANHFRFCETSANMGRPRTGTSANMGRVPMWGYKARIQFQHWMSSSSTGSSVLELGRSWGKSTFRVNSWDNKLDSCVLFLFGMFKIQSSELR